MLISGIIIYKQQNHNFLLLNKILKEINIKILYSLVFFDILYVELINNIRNHSILPFICKNNIFKQFTKKINKQNVRKIYY